MPTTRGTRPGTRTATITGTGFRRAALSSRRNLSHAGDGITADRHAAGKLSAQVTRLASARRGACDGRR